MTFGGTKDPSLTQTPLDPFLERKDKSVLDEVHVKMSVFKGWVIPGCELEVYHRYVPWWHKYRYPWIYGFVRGHKVHLLDAKLTTVIAEESTFHQRLALGTFVSEMKKTVKVITFIQY